MKTRQITVIESLKELRQWFKDNPNTERYLVWDTGNGKEYQWFLSGEPEDPSNAVELDGDFNNPDKVIESAFEMLGLRIHIT